MTHTVEVRTLVKIVIVQSLRNSYKMPYLPKNIVNDITYM